MVADVVELAVGIEEISPKVVSQRCPGIEADADTAIECLVAHGGYTHIFIIPFIPLVVRDRVVPEYL